MVTTVEWLFTIYRTCEIEHVQPANKFCSTSSLITSAKTTTEAQTVLIESTYWFNLPTDEFYDIVIEDGLLRFHLPHGNRSFDVRVIHRSDMPTLVAACSMAGVVDRDRISAAMIWLRYWLTLVIANGAPRVSRALVVQAGDMIAEHLDNGDLLGEELRRLAAMGCHRWLVCVDAVIQIDIIHGFTFSSGLTALGQTALNILDGRSAYRVTEGTREELTRVINFIAAQPNGIISQADIDLAKQPPPVTGSDPPTVVPQRQIVLT